MKLDVAIKKLQKDIDNPGSVPIEDIHEAERLGIEALKAYRKLRNKESLPWPLKLPGETK